MWHAWEMNVYKVLVGKPEENRPLARPRRRWEVGIRMDVKEIDWRSVDWIQLAKDWDRLAGCCEYGDEPSGSGATELVPIFYFVPNDTQ
jgi:hypothetical protein